MLQLVLLFAAAAAESDLAPAVRALERGDFAAAAALADASLLKKPDSADWLVLRARAAMGTGDAAGAMKRLRKALQANPTHVDALYFTAKLTGVLAQQEFARFAKLAPDSARMRLLAAEFHHGRKEHEAARREYQAALTRDPDLVPALTGLGEVDRSDGRCADALPSYQRAHKLQVRNFDALYGMGACHLSMGNLPAALDYLGQAVQADEASVAARIAFGSALVRAGKLEAAVPQLEAAVRLRADAKQAFFLLGRAYQRLGRDKESGDAFARFRQLNAAEAEALETNLPEVPE